MAEEVNKEIVEKQINSFTPPKTPDLNREDIEQIFADAAKRYGYKTVDEFLDAYRALTPEVKNNPLYRDDAKMAMRDAFDHANIAQEKIDRDNADIKRNEDGTMATPIEGVKVPEAELDRRRMNRGRNDLDNYIYDTDEAKEELARRKEMKDAADNNPFKEIAARQYSKWDEK